MCRVWLQIYWPTAMRNTSPTSRGSTTLTRTHMCLHAVTTPTVHCYSYVIATESLLTTGHLMQALRLRQAMLRRTISALATARPRALENAEEEASAKPSRSAAAGVGSSSTTPAASAAEAATAARSRKSVRTAPRFYKPFIIIVATAWQTRDA